MLVVAVVGSMLWNFHSQAILFSLLSFFLITEFHKLTNVDGVNVPKINAALCSLSLPLAIYLCFRVFENSRPMCLLAVYPVWLFVSFAAELWRRQTKPLQNIAFFTFGQLYITLPLSLITLLCMGLHFSNIVILSIFVFIWVNDSFAYLVGSFLGRHKLFERISPKKSWEGFIGGNLFALAAAAILSHFCTDLSLVEWLCLAEMVVLAGTVGDFFESLIKRTLNVKDSGNAIPGHGGWLDRFDSFIFAVVPASLYLIFIAL